MPSNSLNTVSFHNDSSLLVYNSVQQHQPSIQRPAFDLDEFLKKHLFFTKSKIIYQKDDLVALCLQARLALQQDNSSMSALINIPYLPINIVGDIHGQWRDLLRIFSTLGVPGKARYLFLGDYVDRGKRSLECISLLLALKIKYPKMVYLLRGNHECDYINWNYGFQKDCAERFSYGDAMAVFKAFNELFNYLPLAAIVVDRILCMHGGISPKLTSLDALRKIHLPIKVAHDDQLPLDLLWSDPMPKDKAEKERGFIENDLRECSYYFGADTVINLCTKLGLDLIVRGHQSMKNGFGFFAQRRLLTIFSAPGYTVTEKPIFGTDEKIYTPSFGAVAKITRNFELSIVIFRPRTLADTRTFEEIYEENNSGQGPGTESEITIIEKMPKDLPSDSLMGRV